jgi:phage tail-like protein
MANEPEYPFTTFNFRLELQVGDDGADLCDAEFSECDGMEMSLEPKTIREGGNNSRPIHLVGPISYGQLTLKRGMTSNFGLWEWFEKVQRAGGGGVRASGEIAIQSADGSPGARTDRVRFALTGCLPIKLKVPSLNAKDGGIAIEELQVAYEGLSRVVEGGEEQEP